MITFRREYLDILMEARIPTMLGRVLDVGGRKSKKRGLFRPPLAQVECWHYANPDASAEPDFLATAEALPVGDASYDLVVMTEVLEYLNEPAKALAEVKRALRNGGFALIAVPLHSPVHGDWKHDHFRFTQSGLEYLLKQVGFSGVEITRMGGIGAVLFDFWEAATGYANPAERSIKMKILRKILFLSVPLFRFTDKIFSPASSFITTGYFIVARK